MAENTSEKFKGSRSKERSGEVGRGERPIAVVTGASSGIGRELARVAALNGFDLVICADNNEIKDVAKAIAALGVNVRAVRADLSTTTGVDALYDAVGDLRGRIEAVFANAGRTLGGAFLDENWEEVRDVIDTNVLGTVYLLHKFASDMRRRKKGRILITGSIAGFVPGPYQAIYNSSKAFLDSFSYALRHELKDSGITVTCLMPGLTDTEIFEKGHMSNTTLAHSPKGSALSVAIAGFGAMMRGEGSIIPGFHNRLATTLAGLAPQGMLASVHAKAARPHA